MTDGMVIDANIIPKFNQELGTETGGIFKTVTWILDNCGIAINDYIAIEWENVCKSILFNAWYTDALKNGKIRKVTSRKIEKHILKMMESNFGFPINSMDIKYIECANGTIETRYIMTYNYHFYEPKCMRLSASAKKRAREDREGTFCKYVKKYLAINIGMPCHCEEDFGIC